MTQINLFPQENQEKPRLVLVGLVTGALRVQDASAGFFFEDFQDLDAAVATPLGGHSAFDGDYGPCIFASVACPDR